MELTLEKNEATVLREVLQRFLSDLRMEITHTEKYELRESLKAQEVMIKSLIERLVSLEAAPAGGP